MCPNLCYPIKDCAIFNKYYDMKVVKILKFTITCLFAGCKQKLFKLS